MRLRVESTSASALSWAFFMSMAKTTPKHMTWIQDTNEEIVTVDGKKVKVLELKHNDDPEVLSDWAKHFRNHYCKDSEIDYFRRGPNLSRSEYLKTIKFPSQSAAPGPSIRSGDFGEILVADYLEFSLEYWVPRTRYGNKTISNESTKGSDILGFKFVKEGKESSDDVLAIFESKSQFSGTSCKTRLQDAVDDSSKDYLRKAESLNAIRQRLHDEGRLDESSKIERYQNHIDHPYKEVSGAAALFSTDVFNGEVIKNTTVENHPNKNHLVLVVIKGTNMMDLVNELYRRAANEA